MAATNPGVSNRERHKGEKVSWKRWMKGDTQLSIKHHQPVTSQHDNILSDVTAVPAVSPPAPRPPAHPPKNCPPDTKQWASLFSFMSALSVKYLNNFLKGSFVIKNLPYVNAAVSQQDKSRPELQPEVELSACTGVCVTQSVCTWFKDIVRLEEAGQATIKADGDVEKRPKGRENEPISGKI